MKISYEIQTNVYKISDILQSQLIGYEKGIGPLTLAMECDGIEVKEDIGRGKIQYIVTIPLAEFDLIKEEIDYVLYFVVDNMPPLESGYVENGEDCNYLIFEQKIQTNEATQNKL